MPQVTNRTNHVSGNPLPGPGTPPEWEHPNLPSKNLTATRHAVSPLPAMLLQTYPDRVFPARLAAPDRSSPHDAYAADCGIGCPPALVWLPKKPQHLQREYPAYPESQHTRPESARPRSHPRPSARETASCIPRGFAPKPIQTPMPMPLSALDGKDSRHTGALPLAHPPAHGTRD